ncbi:MAG: LamG-like jellyroll fold domain-containing protein [Phycisphaerales bacterium]
MKTRGAFGVVLASGFMTATFLSLSAQAGWTRKADMPTARTSLAACVVDGKIYAIGGAPQNQVVTATVEQYDPGTDTWTPKASMQTPRAFFGASEVNGRIYAVGGWAQGGAYLASCEEYNPVADTWTTKASMSTGRCFLSTVAVGGKLYVLGGGTRVGGNSLNDPTMTLLTVEEYDPVTDTWTRKADLPRLHGGPGAASEADGTIYFAGAGDTLMIGTGSDRGVPLVDAYDPATDTWTTKASMLTARAFFSSCATSGKIYAIGGCVTGAYNSSETFSIEAYDPATDTWSWMPDMQFKRKGLASAAVNGKIYAIGGVPNAGWEPALAIVEEYDLTPPPPDFNGDGIVDMKDLLRLIRSWGQDDPVVDIAPSPFGDGKIDAADLEMLMGYWGREIQDVTLKAHWKLDETEGAIATDSAGVDDGILLGGPVWQSASGKIGGALQLDGVDDCVTTEFTCDPSEGPFSVFAWVKGGAPGQVILSQAGGANWLVTSSTDGTLTTDLKSSGRQGKTLASTALVTDNSWHRVGLSWDGETRILYIDDVEVARDTQANVPSSTGGLYIGTGSTLAPGTFWSGLIDDVRIYNRALLP